MKYSTLLKLIYSNFTSKDYYLCHVLEATMKQYPQHSEHAKKFNKYINRLLKEELAERRKVDPSWERANTLKQILQNRYGINYDVREARQKLVAKLIAYHEARGN